MDMDLKQNYTDRRCWGDENVTVYGQRLAEAMAKNGYSVKQLVKIAGVSPSTIYSALERETVPNAFTLACLADALGVSMDWLWGRK